MYTVILLLTSLASAAPDTFSIELDVVMQDDSFVLLEGTHSVTFDFTDVPAGGSTPWSTTETVTFAEGRGTAVVHDVPTSLYSTNTEGFIGLRLTSVQQPTRLEFDYADVSDCAAGSTVYGFPQDDDDDGHGSWGPYGWGNISLSLSCTDAPPAGSAAPDDCDDDDDGTHPGADELCDDVDNDCDGDVDEDAVDQSALFEDGDEDGFGGVAVTSCPEDGLVDVGGDCNDASAAINPGADELCDATDHDCDGDNEADAVDADTFYADADADGFGDEQSPTQACSQPSAHVADDTDCDDDDANSFPGNDERCDAADRDCDGDPVADAIDTPTWYADADGDGFGDSAIDHEACDAPDGFVASSADCNDDDATVHPDADDTVGDATDQDCDGIDGTDADRDGFASTASGGDDCDDADADVNPDSDDPPYDGVDANCDGRDECDLDGDGVQAPECGGDDRDDRDASTGAPACATSPMGGAGWLSLAFAAGLLRRRDGVLPPRR